MPTIDGLNFTEHGYERLIERGLTTDEVRWAMNGNRRAVEGGKTLCQRWYTDANGHRWGIFVVLSGANRIVTVWVREG